MDISWTWLGIAVLALTAAACIMGFQKGFVKEIVSVFFMLISFLLVWAVNPYVNTFVKEYTPVYDTIQDKCQTLVSEQIGNKKTLDKMVQLLGKIRKVEKYHRERAYYPRVKE